MLTKGLAGPADAARAAALLAKALELNRRGCDAGELRCCVYLGLMYEQGLGVAPAGTGAG